MKKIIISILFLLLIPILNAQLYRDSILMKLNLKPIITVKDEIGREVDKETKSLRINRNEYFKSETVETREIALSYLFSGIYIVKIYTKDMKVTSYKYIKN
jgi:hypothetical protein